MIPGGPDVGWVFTSPVSLGRTPRTAISYMRMAMVGARALFWWLAILTLTGNG